MSWKTGDMAKSTRLLIAGSGLAGLVVMLYCLRIFQHNHYLAEVTGECRRRATAMFANDRVAFAKAHCNAAPKPSELPFAVCAFPPGNDAAEDYPCDLRSLINRPSSGLEPFQRRVWDLRYEGSEPYWPLWCATILLILAAIPWLWYFLLRRISELRAAISGRAPKDW